MKALFLVLLFSAAQASLRTDIEFLASDALNGRMVGTVENKQAQAWLIEKLQAAHARPAGDWAGVGFAHDFEARSTFVDPQATLKGTNIIGILYPHNIWTAEVPKVMLGAHFDHTTLCAKRFGNLDQICNGAGDNAASVAVLISILEPLSQQIESPVAIAFWDAEESGLVGSNAFFHAPSLNLTQMRLYINLDGLGMNLFRGLESYHFILGAETGGSGLQQLVNGLVESQRGISYNQLSYAFGHRRSDMSSLVLNGYQVPFLFFSDGDGAVYHSNSDETQYLNFPKIESVAAMIQRLTSKVSQSDQIPFVYRAPVIDPASGYAVPYFSDVATLASLYDRVIAVALENEIDAATQTKLGEFRMLIRGLEAKSEATLTPNDRMRMLQAVGFLTQTSRGLTFIP